MKRYAFILCAVAVAFTAATVTVTPREYDTGPPLTVAVQTEQAVVSDFIALQPAVMLEDFVPQKEQWTITQTKTDAGVGGLEVPIRAHPPFDAPFVFNVKNVAASARWKPKVKPILLVPWYVSLPDHHKTNNMA